MNTIEILNPVRTVKISTGDVEVRTIPFVRSFELFKKVSSAVDKLFDRKGEFKLYRKKPAQPGGEQEVELNLEPLQQIITETGDTAAFLIQHATKKDAAFVESLTLAEGIVLLQAAIELNLSPELLKLGNGLAGVLKKTFKTPAVTKR